MFVARGTPRAFLIGIAAAGALTIAITLSLRAAPGPSADFVQPQPAQIIVAEAAEPATTTIDDIVTGSIDRDAGPVPATAGSAGFKAALALIDGKDFTGAFEAATALPSSLEQRVVKWAAITYGNGAIPYDDVQRFETEAPDFVSGVFRTRIEQALLKAEAPADVLIKTLGGAMPNTLDAQIALAQAYVAAVERARATSITQAIWINDTLDAGSEKSLLGALGGLLTAKDHWARAEHLMMNDRAAAVERLLPYLTDAQKSLALARNAVSRNDANTKALLDKVDPSLVGNPIYAFSRAERARQFQLWDEAIGWLNKGQVNDPDPELWWYERRTLIRQLLAAGDATRAYKAAADYTSGPEGRLVEARFHAGWIALSFLDRPKDAVKHFEAMAKLSTLPDSVTQANYWLGRALAAAGDGKAAKAAYTVAAGYGTIYYGLLARAALGQQPVELRSLPATSGSEAAFQSRPQVMAIDLLMANGKADWASALLRNLAPSLKSGGELVLAARLAQTIDAHHLAISIADIADKRGLPLDVFSFPKDGLPTAKLADIDMAAIYAITRTESRFQANAVSRSGAQGLMQLMPQTAKETAKKLGVPYSARKLAADPEYNALLGSSYLAAQLKTYGGSLVLAAAAYNAGAGNANKWIAAYGDPRAANVDPVLWVELIPFEETRKYVQRVLGNYLVYRARLGLPAMDPVTSMHAIPG
ncbi:MAG: lytic transglycosylase domain-containing protein [Devosia sp.]